VADVRRGEPGTLQTLAYNLGRKFGGRDVFERPTKFSYGRADGAQDNNFSISHKTGSFRSLHMWVKNLADGA
jgi:hypothetical protein